MKTNPFYKNNKNRNMDPKEKENINEEELMSEAAQKEAAENGRCTGRNCPDRRGKACQRAGRSKQSNRGPKR